ncbi:hypothetical protein APED_30030 [Acanthopleuribacter pedis]
MRFVSYVTLLLSLAAAPCWAQSPGFSSNPSEPGDAEDVKHVLAARSCGEMDVTLTLPGYAVISGGNQRQALKTGDRLGMEAFKVVAVQDEQIFLETPLGFALLERLENGRTHFRNVRPAEIPLELRNGFTVANRD